MGQEADAHQQREEYDTGHSSWYASANRLATVESRMPGIDIFALPSFRVGPYVTQIVPGEPHEFKRRGAQLQYVHGHEPARIAAWVPPGRQLELLVRLIVSLIHYRSGINNKSNEESLTHSVATGLAELAQNSPEFWVQFNAMMGDHFGRRGWGLRAAGQGATPVQPARVVAGDEAFRFVRIKETATYWAWCNFNERRIEIVETLRGANLCVIVMHECLHLIHWAAGIDKVKVAGTREFMRKQPAALLRFWRDNPRFWAWWLHTLATAQAAPTVAPAWPERGRA